MRLSPGVGTILPRVVLSGGLRTDGCYFPAGTNIGVPHYALHHNETYFSDPFQYQPERWIMDGTKGITEEHIATAQSAFCPFSVGLRSCPGKYLAYSEVTVVLARLIWLFEIRLQEDKDVQAFSNADFLRVMRSRGERLSQSRFVSKHEGIFAQFKRRQ